MTLLELLALLKRRLSLVIALPLVCAFITATYCWGIMPNVYTAETSIYALMKSSTAATDATSREGAVTTGDLNASQMLANDFAELVKNDQIREETALSIGLENLDKFKIDVNSSTSTRVIKISVTGKDPESAALIANKLASEVGDTAVRIMNVEAVNIVSEAKVPAQPSGPPRLLYTLVALLAGLFAAIAVAVIMDMANTTIRNDEEASELLEAPIIGRFPLSKGGHR